MAIANKQDYLKDVVSVLKKHWPENRTINIVCHGHSVPAGYFANGVVDTFNAYPYLLHKGLKHRFPSGVINVIVTAIGGENSESGARRFEEEVLCHRPDVLTIDYGLNDRRIGLKKAYDSWAYMIEKAQLQGVKLILLTPTADITQALGKLSSESRPLQEHAAQIHRLANKYETGLVDSFAVFQKYQRNGGDLSDLLSWSNHPNRNGHELVTKELLRWFPIAPV